jgi:hypothetical protein
MANRMVRTLRTYFASALNLDQEVEIGGAPTNAASRCRRAVKSFVIGVSPHRDRLQHAALPDRGLENRGVTEPAHRTATPAQ